MGKYNFDKVIDRHGTDCLKYDFGMKRKGRDDLLVPGELVRDDGGNIVGCKSLRRP